MSYRYGIVRRTKLVGAMLFMVVLPAAILVAILALALTTGHWGSTTLVAVGTALLYVLAVALVWICDLWGDFMRWLLVPPDWSEYDEWEEPIP